MNGGAWLTLGGDRVDVLLRDLDVVDHWTHRAEQGEFEVDALLGYIAGVPTYMLTGELASCVPLRGDAAAIEEVPYPRRLIERAPSIWRCCRSFSLEYARKHAKRGNRIGAIGQVSKAIMEEGHAVLSERGQWVCNEKRLIELADLSGVHDLFEHVPLEPSVLLHWVDLVAERVQRR